MSGFTGGCQCGAIRYEVSGEPVIARMCHCDDCRRSGGSAFATNVFVKTDDLKVVKGTPKLFHWIANSGNKRGRAFCGDCGTPIYVWNESRPDTSGVRIGTIDDANFVEPKMHLWVSRALASTNLNDNLEKFDAQPPANQGGLKS